MNIKVTLITATSALFLATSCSIPSLETNNTSLEMPDSFRGSSDSSNTVALQWDEFFNDPDLKVLINQALQGNQELKMLAQEVKIAGNEVQAARGEYLPFVTLGAGAGIEKTSANTRDGAVEENLDIREDTAFPDPLPDFLVGAQVSWEVDLWKKLRNAQKASALRFLATQEGQNFVVTRLVAEVAETYYELLALDSRLAAVNLTIEIQKQSLGIARAQKAAARGTELGVQRFMAEVQKNESEAVLVKQEILEAENKINRLVGRFPQSIDRHRVDFEKISLIKPDVGVPSELLENRSDVRQAELELAAAGLDVKVARARFFPKLDLKAGIGYQAYDARFLTSPESLIYGATGELVAPLLNRKAINASYQSANAEQLAKVYNYQQTVLKASVEVVNQMSRASNFSKSVALKREQLDSLESSVENANKLFQNARAEYIEVLFAQREMMEARMELIETKEHELAAIVQTYQALGGGGKPIFRKS